MKLKVGNPRTQPLSVVLEPWATEFLVAPGDHIEFRSAGPVPATAGFDVELHEDQVVIWPDWERALIHAHGSDGALID